MRDYEKKDVAGHSFNLRLFESDVQVLMAVKEKMISGTCLIKKSVALHNITSTPVSCIYRTAAARAFWE